MLQIQPDAPPLDVPHIVPPAHGNALDVPHIAGHASDQPTRLLSTDKKA